MKPDLTQLIIDGNYNSFKNNNVYEGTFNVTGSATAGANTRSFDVVLASPPDLTDVVFNGATDTWFSSDPRPANGWFKHGAIWVRGDDAGAGYVDYGTQWEVSTKITENVARNSVLTVNLVWVQQFVATLSLTSAPLKYRIIDYSVF